MRLGVDQNHGVRRHFRVVCLQVVLDRFVEVFRGCFFDYDRLGRLLRMRLGQLERREKSFRRRRLEIEVQA